MDKKWLIGGIVVVALGVGAGGVWWSGAWNALAKGSASAASTGAVAVIVDGEAIPEREVFAAGTASAPRAQQVDEYVTKVVLARAFERSGGIDQDLQARIDRSRREILFNAWLTRESAQIRTGLKEAEVQSAYDKEVTDDLFAKYRLSYVLSGTSEEATGNSDWKPLKLNGALEWIPTTAVPYGLGAVVKTMKKGESTQTPIVTREGWLRIRVDDIQPGTKPKLGEVKANLTDLLTTRQLQSRVQAARGAADIRLK